MTTPPTRRDRFRAGVLAVVLLANLVMALPLPRGVKRSNFDLPVPREELDKLRALAAGVGVQLTHEELADGFFAIAKPLEQLREALIAPVKPAFRIFGMGQSWGLFTYPDTFPHRLVIDARATGEPWERVYAGLDDEHAFLRSTLAYRRVRGVYDGQTNRPGVNWNNISRWMADRTFEAHPDYDIVRVQFERFHTVPPGGERDEEVVVRHARTYHREAR